MSAPVPEPLGALPHFYARGYRGACGRCGGPPDGSLHLAPGDVAAADAAGKRTADRGRLIRRRDEGRPYPTEAERSAWP